MKEKLLWFYLLTYRGVALQWVKSYLLVELNLYSTVAIILPLNTSVVQCLKDRFWVHYCFCYTLMNWVMCQRPWILYFLPMIPTYFFSHNDPNQLMEIVNNELKKLSSCFKLISFLLT